MCFDPVSLGALAAGTGASIGGGMLNRQAQAEQQQQQMNQNLAGAAARNTALLAFLQQQQKYQGQNAESFKPVTAAIDPTTFRATQAADTANRTNAGTTAISSFERPAVTTSGTDPGVVQREIAARSAAETGKSIRDVGNEAKLKGFGDVFSDLGLTTSDAARHIDTTNSFARTDASLLPAQQELVGAPFSQPVPQTGSPWGSILGGVGNILATAGGSGAASRGLSALNLGDVFRTPVSAMSPAQLFAGGYAPM